METTSPSPPFFIVNPASGGGRTRRRWPRVAEALRRHALEPAAAFTEHRGHGYDLARRAIEDGHETLVAVGGDGTLYEVANAILDLEAHDRVRLGTIGMGTGKDVAKCLGIGRGVAAIRAIARREERRIDVGRVEGHDADGNPQVRHFLLEASAGWVPEVSAAVPRPLKLLGDTAPYVVMVVVKMVGPMGRDFEVTIDATPHHGRYNTISVHNMELWGGDLLVVPGALPDDGLLDVIRWGDKGRRFILRAVQGQRAGGTHLDIDGIDHHPATTVALTSPKPTRLDLDGEYGGHLPARISVVPRAIRFLAPNPPPMEPRA